MTNTTIDVNELVKQIDQEEVVKKSPVVLNFFNETLQTNSNKISLDEIKDGPGMAQFVEHDAVVTAKVLKTHTTSVLTPAYLQVKGVINPANQITRMYNEEINGSLTPSDRKELAIARELVHQRQAINNSFGKIAMDCLVGGGYSLSHTKKDGSTKVITANFNRDTNLSTGTSGAWDDVNFDIAKQIDDVIAKMSSVENGGSPNILVLSPDRWNAFVKNNSVKDKTSRQVFMEGYLNIDKSYKNEYKQVGIYNGLDVYIFNEQYRDENGVGVKIMPQNTALLIGDMGGVVVHTPILHNQSLEAVESFSWGWTDDETGFDTIKTASSGLIIPRRINRTAKITC